MKKVFFIVDYLFVIGLCCIVAGKYTQNEKLYYAKNILRIKN
jgi:hypothetical protein